MKTLVAKLLLMILPKEYVRELIARAINPYGACPMYDFSGEDGPHWCGWCGS